MYLISNELYTALLAALSGRAKNLIRCDTIVVRDRDLLFLVL